MTIKEIANQLYDLTGGQVEGEKKTAREIQNGLQDWFSNKAVTGLFITITLPDGDWLAHVFRDARWPGEYVYYIPDTREAEDYMKNAYKIF